VADEPDGLVALLCSLTDPTRNAEVSRDAAEHFRTTYARAAVFERYDTAFGSP
jgi:hypothetical protein